MRTVKFVLVILLTVFVSSRAMNAMLVQHTAQIFFEKDACPLNLDRDGRCVVVGSLSRNFVTGDAEILLEDGGTLLVRAEQIQGYSTIGEHAEYRPLGKIFAIVVLLTIGIGGFTLALWVSSKR